MSKERIGEMHPEARAAQIGMVKRWAETSGLPGWNPADCASSRNSFRAGAKIKLVAPVDEIAQIDQLTIDLPRGPRQMRVYRPAPERDLPTIVYVHGGGYCVGGLDEADAECRRLASSIGVNVVSTTYGLAPEKPYPEGIEDTVEAIRAIRNGDAGFETGAMAVLGVSAGAGIAVAAVSRMVKADDPELAGLVLLSPFLDLTFSSPSCTLYGTGHFQEMSQLLDFRDLYLPAGVDYAHPDLSPARHPVAQGWPHTILLAAGMDPLSDDAALYARRLEESACSFEARFVRGHLHGFHTWWQVMPSIKPDLEWLDAAIRRTLFGLA